MFWSLTNMIGVHRTMPSKTKCALLLMSNMFLAELHKSHGALRLLC